MTTEQPYRLYKDDSNEYALARQIEPNQWEVISDGQPRLMHSQAFEHIYTAAPKQTYKDVYGSATHTETIDINQLVDDGTHQLQALWSKEEIQQARKDNPKAEFYAPQFSVMYRNDERPEVFTMWMRESDSQQDLSEAQRLYDFPWIQTIPTNQ